MLKLVPVGQVIAGHRKQSLRLTVVKINSQPLVAGKNISEKARECCSVQIIQGYHRTQMSTFGIALRSESDLKSFETIRAGRKPIVSNRVAHPTVSRDRPCSRSAVACC